ncbi:hypothetical protein MTO96_020376 [Rhipicephalus appendiculatus]
MSQFQEAGDFIKTAVCLPTKEAVDKGTRHMPPDFISISWFTFLDANCGMLPWDASPVQLARYFLRRPIPLETWASYGNGCHVVQLLTPYASAVSAHLRLPAIDGGRVASGERPPLRSARVIEAFPAAPTRVAKPHPAERTRSASGPPFRSGAP